jgi:hypothetical protein
MAMKGIKSMKNLPWKITKQFNVVDNDDNYMLIFDLNKTITNSEIIELVEIINNYPKFERLLKVCRKISLDKTSTEFMLALSDLDDKKEE